MSILCSVFWIVYFEYCILNVCILKKFYESFRKSYESLTRMTILWGFVKKHKSLNYTHLLWRFNCELEILREFLL